MKLKLNNNFFVITGGPGSGKTTLLSELENMGYQCIPEVAREIIKEQMRTDGEALPWKNKELFKQLMLDRSVADYDDVSINNDLPVFFDRGILDTLAYAKLIRSPLNKDMVRRYAQTYRYHQKVFLLPPWFAIYQTDDERKQTFEEAVRIYEVLKETYGTYLYEVIEVPCVSINKRVAFILEEISQA
ncbi:AAA family ATPase [Pedobacter cryoconitis]|uniref:Putative ATPase n=1 Tax=Pedobacter cryoconitis TaxID=188932 RepID=A0A7X0J4G6_9SPHI|nr:AAA family ATPase [Pedobacter cryoconitis]MBB6500693.1 putative ATPase [Pedobacter cryoconitis]